MQVSIDPSSVIFVVMNYSHDIHWRTSKCFDEAGTMLISLVRVDETGEQISFVLLLRVFQFETELDCIVFILIFFFVVYFQFVVVIANEVFD